VGKGCDFEQCTTTMFSDLGGRVMACSTRTVTLLVGGTKGNLITI